MGYIRFLCSLFVFSATVSIASDRSKIILDTDLGGDIDDAWALAFVLSHEGFEPLGITITNGNTPARARLACKMLHLTGRSRIPVAVGRKTDDGYAHQFVWAEDFAAVQPVRQPAAAFIVEQAKRYPQEVTLLAVGPLENVADALRLEPRLGSYLRRVVLMSGCIYGRAGNPAILPEWNVRASIPDSHLVYAAGLPLTIVPLDSTTHVRLADAERERVSEHRSPLTFALECLYRLWLSGPESRMVLHDQLAVAEAAAPGKFFGKKETLSLTVDGQGFTRIDAARGKPAVVCLEPKRDEFMDYFISRLIGRRPAG